MNDPIRDTWDTNAAAWTHMVRNERSETRRLVTDAAVVNAVKGTGGRRVLDVGCGEGWLVRELTAAGCDVTGIDGSSDLVRAAESLGTGSFQHVTYDQLIADPHAAGGPFDVAVFNFALLDESIRPLLTAARAAVSKSSGRLVIQTVHPFTACEGNYRNGWREESFAGLPGTWSTMPWYFRTLSTWLDDVRGAGWAIDQLIEPPHPHTGLPASLIIIASVSPASPSAAAPS